MITDATGAAHIPKLGEQELATILAACTEVLASGRGGITLEYGRDIIQRMWWEAKRRQDVGTYLMTGNKPPKREPKP